MSFILASRSVAFLAFAAMAVVPSLATPQFAREYQAACSNCHVHGAKLNDFGEAFVANGYRMAGFEKKKSFPIAVWVSLQHQNRTAAPDDFKTAFNRLELISGGRFDAAPFSYFVEWRTVSKELQGDGSERDRSGRFEDAYINWEATPSVGLQVGQFRALSQIDVSRRIGLAEPSVFATSQAGEADSDARITSLRGFSPSGRSLGIRIGYSKRKSEESADGTYATLAAMFPGEFSIPLNDEARTTASNEFESQAKGLFAELYERRGTSSYGIHAFTGNNERNYLGLAGQARSGRWFFEGGIGRAETQGADEFRYSVTADWIRDIHQAHGLRVEHRQIAGQRVMLAPYTSWTIGDGPTATRFIAEARFQKRRYTQFVFELGFQF